MMSPLRLSSFLLVLLHLSPSTAAKKVWVTYGIDMYSTGVPDDVWNKIFGAPETYLKPFLKAFPNSFLTLPGAVIVPPKEEGGARQLRGSNQDADRDLQLSTCSSSKQPRICSSSMVVADSSTTDLGGVRQLFPASLPAGAVEAVANNLSRKLTKDFCGGISGCSFDVQLTQLY